MYRFLPPTRRGFIESLVAGGLGLAFSPLPRWAFGARPTNRAKACILVWLNGGPSHIDTFDPKPGTATGGPFRAINTRVAGVQFCEHLPKLADINDRLAVVRSLHSKEEDHDGAYRLLHSGSAQAQGVELPSIGALVARSAAANRRDLPPFVSILGDSLGPGFLGLEFAPLVVNDLENPIANLTPSEGLDEARLRRRLTAVAKLNQGFARRADPVTVAEIAQLTDQAIRLGKSPDVNAFRLDDEPPAILERYGAAGDAPQFGKACILARRLVERGVSFVEVRLDGWDTHENNFNSVGELLGRLDPGLAGLVADLSERSMLDETLVVCMGEFGRTPRVNPQNGRDHWAHAFSAVVAGGGVRGGQVIGASDETGSEVADRPVSIADFYATLLKAAGVDPSETLTTPEGRPIRIAEGGQIVNELFS